MNVNDFMVKYMKSDFPLAIAITVLKSGAVGFATL